MKIRRVSIPPGLRVGLTWIIVFMVISSPVVIIFNPSNALANPSVTDTSSSHATLLQSQDPSPSMSSLGTPTIQAPLQIPRTLQSTDLVNSLAFYEVTFITSTTGAIDKIRMDFPAGTGVGAAGIIERVGIGGGTLLKSGSSITYDVTSPVSIPAGTFIRLEMFGIKNPINPSTTFTADITTRDSVGNLIDGPSQTNVYTIKKVGSSDLADGSVTSTKPAESFMKRVTLNDNAAGNAVGWDPNGVEDMFFISESAIISREESLVSVILPFTSIHCVPSPDIPGEFNLDCNQPPNTGTTLQYIVTNLPPHVVS